MHCPAGKISAIMSAAQAFVTSFLTRCLRTNTEHTAQTAPSMVPVVDTARLLPRCKHSSERPLSLDFEGEVWIRDMSRAVRAAETNTHTWDVVANWDLM